MDVSTLEARVALLERSLRRSRLTAGMLGLGALAVVTATFAQRPRPALAAQQQEPVTAQLLTRQEQTQERVSTQRLSLTNELGVEMVGLAAGADGSLLVLSPDGREILRLGGDPARRIGH